MALGIGPGDEVLTTSYTFFATGGTISRVGARPVFLDIDSQTFNLSPSQVREFLEGQCDRKGALVVNRATGGVVRAIVPVHLYGQMADMPALQELATAFGLRVIEDAAQAIGSEDAVGRRACSYGDIGCLSFFPSKNLGAFGDAGMCVTNDQALASFMRVLRVHGGEPKYYHAYVGGNFRLDEIQAAVLRVKLRVLDEWTGRRRKNAAVYDDAFDGSRFQGKIDRPYVVPGFKHIYNQYVIRASKRDALRARLADAGIGTEIYYPVPLHLQKCFSDLAYAAGDLPESELAAAQSLALPVFPELSEGQLQYVIDTVAAFADQHL
jgi:dTDP-4-amino-4,6-dideoxygalactose transaminase